MSLDSLPTELFLRVMSYLDSPEDRNALARTSRRCHSLLNRELYILSIVDINFHGLFWAARRGQLGTLQRFLDAASPGFHMICDGLDVKWRPTWGARFNGDLLQCIPVFNYEGHIGYYGNKHMPFFSLYRDALVEAALHGQMQAFQLLAGHIPWHLSEIDCHESGEDAGWLSLSHLAALHNQPTLMQLLLNDGVNLMSDFPQNVQENTPSPFHIACREGHVEVLEILLRQRVEPDMLDFNGVTPMILAISWGNGEVVQILLDYGADAYQTFRLFSILSLATVYGEASVLEILLQTGLSPDGLDANGNLHPIIGTQTRELHTGEMRQHSSSSISQSSYRTPLALAALLNEPQCARILLEHGAKPNFVEPNGEIPLHIALEHGSLETASILIQGGARRDMIDGLGNTAIHYALLPGDGHWSILESLTLLIDNGSPEITPEWIFRVLEYEHSHPGVSLPPAIIKARETVSGPPSYCQHCDSLRSCDRRHSDDSFYQRLYEPGAQCQCAKAVELFLNQGIHVDAYEPSVALCCTEPRIGCVLIS
ncbi:uncharacterized protein N7483_008119 [Penicillium malachiteum]|uniref:uncharacterized protein n=1 Tax=Penicillium malachiteum TaxID=1324776 RepID=UPI0025465C9E|nr:uncharacterized protein N7483_008119 [Penicillium malachiteum]KAJ5726762.1 hypothetical protein N7483_008119 [Penicillium malachiteum]